MMMLMEQIHNKAGAMKIEKSGLDIIFTRVESMKKMPGNK
jgi:hypothetical protein